ncbi:hypothetical protein THIOSC15_2720009 [uncultured Thiomicrorhabdus sp.]
MGGVDNTHSGDWYSLRNIITKAKPDTVTTAAKFKKRELEMAINLYPICWRGRNDCEPIHCIDAEPPATSEEDILEFNYQPISFVCCGCNTSENRTLEQDKYRLCFKNKETDEMSDNDLQDLTSIISVISAALNLDAVRKVNNGIVEIPAEQVKIKGGK